MSPLQRSSSGVECGEAVFVPNAWSVNEWAADIQGSHLFGIMEGLFTDEAMGKAAKFIVQVLGGGYTPPGVLPLLDELEVFCRSYKGLLRDDRSMQEALARVCPATSDDVIAARQRMARVSRSIGNGRLVVRRPAAFSDSIPLLSSRFVKSDQPRGVGFQGEAGSDMGGITRDWFTEVGQLVARRCDNDPTSGLFVQENGKSYLVVDKHRTQTQEDMKAWYAFGRLMALAIIKNEQIAIELPVYFYARFLKGRVELKDLRPELEEAAHNYENTLRMTPDKFDQDGVLIDFEELPEDQAGTTVTFANKESVIARILGKYASGEDEPAFEQMRAGFSAFLDLRTMSERISAADLKRLVSGDDTLDVPRLKAMATATRVTTQQFDWLFEWLQNANTETQHNFMQFVTGSRSFSPRRIEIRGPSVGQGALPRAHTCFNQLDLPRYDTEQAQAAAMEEAVVSNDFGFA